jgi:uncharacterized RDD family membrane protein YckC
MELFYAVENEQKGPVDETEFQRLYESGVIREDTLVFTAGMTDWISLADARRSGAIKVIESANPPQMASTGPAEGVVLSGDTVNCPNCGSQVDPSDLIPLGNRQVCPACRDIALQQMREGVETTPHAFNFAGFGIRFGSYLIDMVLLTLVQIPVNMVLFGLSFTGIYTGEAANLSGIMLIAYYATSYLVPAMYAVGFLGNPKLQATPGMLITKIKVIRGDGERVTYGRALGRYLASILSSLILAIGYFMMLWDDEKRTLHDRIADTRVIRK